MGTAVFILFANLLETLCSSYLQHFKPENKFVGRTSYVKRL